jgi:hypothetical protein
MVFFVHNNTVCMYFFLEKTMLTKVLYPLVGCIFHAQNVLFDVTITLNQYYWMYFFSCTRKQVNLTYFLTH